MTHPLLKGPAEYAALLIFLVGPFGACHPFDFRLIRLFDSLPFCARPNREGHTCGDRSSCHRKGQWPIMGWGIPSLSRSRRLGTIGTSDDPSSAVWGQVRRLQYFDTSITGRSARAPFFLANVAVSSAGDPLSLSPSRYGDRSKNES
jgi:hypothetical protein